MTTTILYKPELLKIIEAALEGDATKGRVYIELFHKKLLMDNVDHNIYPTFPALIEQRLNGEYKKGPFIKAI